MQQIENANDRALTLPDSDTSSSITLPTLASRKGKYLAFNSTSGAAEIGGDVADTGTVANQSANISTLAGINANITTVAGIASNVTTVAGISSNVTTVAGANSNISALNASGVISNIATVAGNNSNITTVAGNNANISTVAGISSNVTAVAGVATAITDNLTAIQNAASNAASVASVYDSFDDRYLGVKSSAPTTDNDSNALVAGTLYFNSTTSKMQVYDGSSWIDASSAGTTSLVLYEYTATSSQTTFTGNDDNSASLSYTVGNIIVCLNGVILDPSDFTATNGTSVVLASGATTNDILNVYAFKSFTVSDTVSKASGGTFGANVTVSGTMSATTFSGSGASLTALNASNLGSGTIPDARFPSTLPAVSGANLTGIAGTPSGVLAPFAGTSEPTGWLFCYGQAVSRSTYSDLFSAISTTYGTGDGSSTFNLPDLRGRVVAGQDDMGGSSANRMTSPINGDTLGATGGVESVSGSSSSHTHPFSDAYNYTYTAYRSGTTSATSLTYLGSANVIQPTIVLNYIIKT